MFPEMGSSGLSLEKMLSNRIIDFVLIRVGSIKLSFAIIRIFQKSL